MTFERDEVDDAVADWCEQRLGAEAVRVRWRRPHEAGGLELADGRTIVVHVYGPDRGVGALDAINEVQAHLATSWFPCARPLAGPSPFGRGWARADVMIDDPGPIPAEERDLVGAAATLARLVRYTDRAVDAAHLAALRPDLTSPGEGGGDLLARAIEGQRADRTRPVVTHLDWSATSVRARRSGVSAVFGFDHVALVPDSFGAGRAAVTWGRTVDGDAPPPSPDGIAEFLDVYQQVRGYRFRPDQLRAAWGSALRALTEVAEPGAADVLARHGDELAARASGSLTA